MNTEITSTELFFDRIRKVIAEVLAIDANEIGLKDSFIGDLECDELDSIEIVLAIEEAFDIDFPDEDAEKILTVEQLVEYVEKAPKR